MSIQDDSFVAIEYTLTLDDGQVVDASSPGEPLPFVMGAGMIVKGLEEALRGKDEGFVGRVTVDPENGYGEIQADLVQEMRRDRFPDDLDLDVGMVLQAMTPDGPVNFQVTKVAGDVVVADFNHPMAGRRLHFDVKVAEVRVATEADMAMFGCGGECDHGCGGCGGH